MLLLVVLLLEAVGLLKGVMPWRGLTVRVDGYD